MSLTLRPGIHARRPYNDSVIRWKVMEVTVHYSRFMMGAAQYEHTLHSMYKFEEAKHGFKHVPVKRWLKSKNLAGTGAKPHDIGWHVYVNRGDAEMMRAMRPRAHVVKVEVRGFIAAGTFMNDRAETWKEMKVLEVLDDFDNNIVHTLNKRTKNNNVL